MGPTMSPISSHTNCKIDSIDSSEAGSWPGVMDPMNARFNNLLNLASESTEAPHPTLDSSLVDFLPRKKGRLVKRGLGKFPPITLFGGELLSSILCFFSLGRISPNNMLGVKPPSEWLTPKYLATHTNRFRQSDDDDDDDEDNNDDDAMVP